MFGWIWQNRQAALTSGVGVATLLSALAMLAACATSPQPGATDATVAGVAVTATPVIEPPAPSPAPAALGEGASATATPLAVPDEAPFHGVLLELGVYAGRSGEAIALRTGGFTPGETVRVEFAGSPDVTVGEWQTNERGELVVADLRLPALAEGQYSLSVTGSASGRQTSRIFSIIGFHPWVVLSNYAPHPGETFGFAGSEFVPGEQVLVFIDGATEALATATADGRGNVSLESLIVATPRLVGKHNLEFVGSQDSVRLPVAFEVLPFVPVFELSTYAGPPGSVIGFTGHGFAPGESIHAYIENDNREVVARFQADINGAFANAGQFVIPVAADIEQLTLTLEGADSLVPVSQRFGVLPLAPWAGLSAYSGPGGTQVDLFGKGFAAGETVDVYLGSGNSATKVISAVADGRGEFQAGPYAIPGDIQGTAMLTFRGLNSHGEASTEFTVVGQ